MSLFIWIARQVNWVANQRFAWYWRYGSAVIAVALALLVTWAIPAIRTGTPFMFFFLAVSVSALLGNFRSGLLATILSVLAVDLWLVHPVGMLKGTFDDFVRLGGFFVVATLISLLAFSVRLAHQSAFEQAEWLRATLASIGDAVIATDREGKVVWLNAVAEKLTGWEMREAIAQPLDQVFNVVDETTRTPVASAVESVLARGESLGPVNHMLLVARDGRDYPIESSAAPIRSTQGAIAGAVLVFHNISERRQREKELQATEERLRIALKAGHMVAWEWDVQRDSIWTTDNFADIFGVAPIHSVAEGVQMLHPEDVDMHQAAVNRVREGSSGYHLDFRIVRPDNGGVVWLQEWGFGVPTEPGQPPRRVVGVTADITERKLAEEQIRQLNAELAKRVQELQAIFDTAWVGIAVAEDPSLHVVVRNQTLAEWFGVPKGRGIAKNTAAGANLPFTLFYAGEEMPPDELPMQRAIATGKSVVSEELEVVRGDGQRMTVVVSATPTFDDNGCVSGCVGIFTDISKRKAAEQALHQLNLTLEERVAERTAELEQINRELVEFTNVVSHDLRSPLRAITMLADWVSEESASLLPARSKEHLSKMRQRIQRMEKLLNDLVAYTRAGRVHYGKELVDTSVLVRDICQLFDAPPNFRTEVIEPMPCFVTERVPLETVLRNLIGNAFKHHPEPERGRVVISARDLGSQFEFSVVDNGAGIRSEYHERIFGVFQTLRPRDEVEGSGMGLAIAKRLVEGRGGRITVESSPDHGSTFKFTWPK